MNTFTPAAGQVATHAAAVATMAAPTDGTRWELFSVSYSYSATPSAGASLVISWSGVSETYYIPAGGPGMLSWSQPRRFPPNVQVTITLSDGGVGVIGTVYPQAMTTF